MASFFTGGLSLQVGWAGWAGWGRKPRVPPAQPCAAGGGAARLCSYAAHMPPLAHRPPSQVEHHLFPAISFCHYPAIAVIVEDECRKRGVQYARYDTLPEILGRFVRYMAEVGRAEQVPMSKHAADLAKV